MCNGLRYTGPGLELHEFQAFLVLTEAPYPPGPGDVEAFVRSMKRLGEDPQVEECEACR